MNGRILGPGPCALALLCAATSACADEQRLPKFHGCGSDSTSTATSTGLSVPTPVPDSACDAVVTEELLGPATHVEECERIRYPSNPPASGPHYGTWAAFMVHEQPVPRGFWVHSLEHGAVAILHRCTNCGPELEQARALIDELPEDPLCFGAAVSRVLMTEDPLLDVPWAAAAWGFTLRSQCFEPEVFRRFALDRRGRGPENVCAPGRSF